MVVRPDDLRAAAMLWAKERPGVALRLLLAAERASARRQQPLTPDRLREIAKRHQAEGRKATARALRRRARWMELAQGREGANR